MCQNTRVNKKPPSESSSRPQQVINAAIEVFLRYGYVRTTMADIAKAAGLTRPTLYLSFPDKESIFRAVVETMVETKFTAIRDGVARRSGLDAQLQFACETWGAEGFEMALANPDAKDMFDIGFTPVLKSYLAFENLLTDIIRKPIEQAGLSVKAADVARVIVFGMKGFKDIAKDGKEMRKMIAAQTAVVTAALRPLQSERGGPSRGPAR
jgi:AcrR family transcriptional regulator